MDQTPQTTLTTHHPLTITPDPVNSIPVTSQSNFLSSQPDFVPVPLLSNNPQSIDFHCNPVKISMVIMNCQSVVPKVRGGMYYRPHQTRYSDWECSEMN